MIFWFNQHLKRLGWSEAGALNLLVDAGIVSDQVLKAPDIPKEDMEVAVEWMRAQKRKIEWE